MNKKGKLALFLGMLSGDGCIPIGHNGEGYRNYYMEFCNTDKSKVELFNNLLYAVFGITGKITSCKRINRKKIWNIRKYSKETVEKIIELGFPEGVKRDILRIPEFIIFAKRN